MHDIGRREPWSTPRAGLLEVWDFRTRFAPLMECDPPPSLEALQHAAAAPGDDGAAVFLQLLSPLITDVRRPVGSKLSEHAIQPRPL